MGSENERRSKLGVREEVRKKRPKVESEKKGIIKCFIPMRGEQRKRLLVLHKRPFCSCGAY